MKFAGILVFCLRKVAITDLFHSNRNVFVWFHFVCALLHALEKTRLFQKVRIICAAATISTCKPQISQNCEIASIYQGWKASMAKQGRRKPATIFGGKFPNYCDGSLRERKKRQMRLTNFGRGSSFAHLLCSFGRFVILTAALAHSLSSKIS